MVQSDLLKLRDGRTLAVYSYGQGPAVLFHHGTPGTGYPLECLKTAADLHGVRVVAYDRAGYGGSSPNPGRTVASVAADMRELLDFFGIEQALTAGWSGGGPHTLATAALLPDRITGVAVIAGVGPSDADDLDYFAEFSDADMKEWEASQQGRAALLAFYEEHHSSISELTAEQVRSSVSDSKPLADQEFLRGAYADELVEIFHRALAPGLEGMVDDSLAFASGWGFDVEQVRQPIVLFYGGLDKSVPITHGQWLSRRLPQADARFFEEDGHTSIAIGRMSEVFAALLGRD